MYAEGAERQQQRESSAYAASAANPEFTLPSSVQAPESVQQFARNQARVLGAGSPESSHIWGRAELRFFPLGPGTHGWLVHAYVDDAALGYMIIVASEQGDLVLSEYGEGKEPLYSFTLLKKALLRQQLDPQVVTAGGGSIELRYMPPMLAYWSVKQKTEILYISTLQEVICFRSKLCRPRNNGSPPAIPIPFGAFRLRKSSRSYLHLTPTSWMHQRLRLTSCMLSPCTIRLNNCHGSPRLRFL